jgi:hypothetical protein
MAGVLRSHPNSQSKLVKSFYSSNMSLQIIFVLFVCLLLYLLNTGLCANTALFGRHGTDHAVLSTPVLDGSLELNRGMFPKICTLHMFK